MPRLACGTFLTRFLFSIPTSKLIDQKLKRPNSLLFFNTNLVQDFQEVLARGVLGLSDPWAMLPFILTQIGSSGMTSVLSAG